MASDQALKKAIQWVSDQRQDRESSWDSPVTLANEAAFRFDLSPKDSEFLLRFVKTGQEPYPYP